MNLPVLNESVCNRCVGLCCQYVTIEIEKPRGKRAKDDARWYVLHEGVTLIIEEDRWHVKLPSRCTKLNDDNTCSIYHERPQTCRDYSNDNCDYFSEYEGWDRNYVEIETPEELDKYFLSKKRKPAKKSKTAAKKKK
ncbi:MAG: YkgJ family cysteine cluster protein [bacterium]|nr:YkgJ family cysteine cluster protein [bacterium]